MLKNRYIVNKNMFQVLLIALIIASLFTYFYYMTYHTEENSSSDDTQNMLYPIFIIAFICCLIGVSFFMDNHSDADLHRVLKHTQDGPVPF